MAGQLVNSEMTSTLENERLFHNQRFGGDDSGRASLAGYYSINRSLLEYYKHQVLEVCQGKELLDYGCGTGETSFDWTKSGARVTGIDLSDEGIKKARDKAKEQNIEVSFFQMDAENMQQFEAHSFDVVTGVGILHHLNLDKAYGEIARVLRRNGQAVFVEPLGHNLFINMYRRFTPSLRTKDEHPLTIEDLETAKKYFREVRIRYFFIFSLLAVPFRRRFFFKQLLGVLESGDRALMYAFPFVRRYAWQVVMQLTGPVPHA
jgi:ubiquinone/menaquinone biosynthesis C-methylase UbiE